MFASVTLAALIAVMAAPVAFGDVPLFASQEPLELRLDAPIKALRRADKETWMRGRLSHAGTNFDVEFRARGKFRLDLCRMPPLWIRFDKEQVKDTVFEKQRRLKLVSFCRETDKWEEYIVLEYLVYRIYNLITPESYRVRPARIVYVEQDSSKATEPRFSILLEHKRLLNKRLGTQSLQVPKLAPADLNPVTASLLEMFAYLIGNTDWSALQGPAAEGCCHNVHVFAPKGQGVATGTVVPVAYDFDQTGFVNPSYQQVNERLGIRSVKQRLYRGWCRDPSIQAQTYATFIAQRGAIEQLVTAQEGLSEKTRAKALKWIGKFYEIIDDPKSRTKKIDDKCRGKG
jgi:hypothetical protein